MVEPGLYDRTSPGGFVLGRVDGAEDPRLNDLARVLEAVGPTTVTSNLAGARWSKLAINCAISSLGTIGGDRLGPLIRHRHIRRLCLEIMTEVVQVARASGVRLEKVSGTLDLDWIALSDSERHIAGSPGLVAKHTLLLAVGARFRRMRSSMLAAIERGRPPAVDFLNGEVATRGDKLGVPTPINKAIREQVLEIARGKAKPGIDLTRRFFERTRSLVTPEALAERPAPPPQPPQPPQEELQQDARPAGHGSTDMMAPLPEALVVGAPPPGDAPPAGAPPAGAPSAAPAPTIVDDSERS